MTEFKPGDRVTFSQNPYKQVGTVRTWTAKEWRRFRTINDYRPDYWWDLPGWVGCLLFFYDDLRSARFKDAEGLNVSVKWDGQSEFGCDGYDPEVLRHVR